MDISNGEGIGIALFVQGCPFHCKGCFNPETWDFNGGKEWTEEIEQEFISLAGQPHIKRISILGGEPMCEKNYSCVLTIVSKLKEIYPQKQIWLYTGYVLMWPDKQDGISPILDYCDVIVDGQFDADKRDMRLKFRGSSNQRVIDVKESLKQNKIVLYYKDGE